MIKDKTMNCISIDGIIHDDIENININLMREIIQVLNDKIVRNEKEIKCLDKTLAKTIRRMGEHEKFYNELFDTILDNLLTRQ